MIKKKNIGGIDLSYYEFGKGEPLLFLHGGRTRASTYKKSLDELSKKYRVIAPDIPGYGDSSVPNTPWSFEDYAKFFQSFVNRLELKEFVVVGYSFGGGIAYNLAFICKNVKKLILVDAAVTKKTNGELRNDVNRLIFYLFRPQYYSILCALIKEGILFNLKYLGNRDKITNARANLRNTNRFLENISVPTVIIWATRDSIFPVDTANKLHKSIKHSRLILVNENHEWPLFNQKLFVKYVFRALK